MSRHRAQSRGEECPPTRALLSSRQGGAPPISLPLLGGGEGNKQAYARVRLKAERALRDIRELNKQCAEVCFLLLLSFSNVHLVYIWLSLNCTKAVEERVLLPNVMLTET